MADDIIKLAGETLPEPEAIFPQLTEEICHLADKAIELGAPSDIANQFTTEGLHALRAQVAPDTAVKFKMHFQTEALELLGVDHAETALLFTDEIKSAALKKALTLGLSPQIALDVNTDALLSAFNVLAEGNPIVKALKLEVPIKHAFAFDTEYKVGAWEFIKKECKNIEECIENSLNTVSQAKLDALLTGIEHQKANEFSNMYQVQALYKLKDLATRRELAVSREDGARWALAIDTQNKWDALDKGVDPQHAARFLNNHQVQAWYVMKTFIADKKEEFDTNTLDKATVVDYAMAIDTETKLEALHAGVEYGQASKFTNSLQVEAWKLIHTQISDKKQSAEYALEITDEIKLKALQIGVYPRDAINFKTQIQIDAWERIKDKEGVNKLDAIQDIAKLKNSHQLDVFIAGADLKDALQITEYSQAKAYVIYNVPFALAMNFTEPHQIQLLSINMDPEEASKTNWYQAQHLLLKANPTKYLIELLKDLKTSVGNKIDQLRKNPNEIPAFVGVPVAMVTSLFFGVWIIKKIALKCCKKQEYDVGSTIVSSVEQNGVIITATLVVNQTPVGDSSRV